MINEKLATAERDAAKGMTAGERTQEHLHSWKQMMTIDAGTSIYRERG